MRYRRDIIRYGTGAEVYIYPVKEGGRKGPGSRSGRRKASRECQKRLNNIHRAARLAREIPFNFGRGDLFLSLTYDDEHNPGSYERAAKDFQNFLQKINRARARAELAAAKCIWVTEQGSKSGRWHHHCIISGGIDWAIFSEKWGGGYVKMDPLRPSLSSYKHLAKYVCKAYYEVDSEQEQDEDEESGKAADKLRGGRLHRTRNIETPPTLSNDFEISRRKAARIAGELMQGDDAGEVLPLLKGYRIEQKGAFFNEIDGHFYIRIFLVCDDKGRARKCTDTARSKKGRSGKTGRSSSG
jgi:hypothetical protein